MAAAAQFRTEHIAETPRGYHVRQFAPGSRSEHLVRVAFPPGRRKKGSGKLVEILHPASERNPKCDLSETARKNPGELLIFGNPSDASKVFKVGTKKEARYLGFWDASHGKPFRDPPNTVSQREFPEEYKLGYEQAQRRKPKGKNDSYDRIGKMLRFQTDDKKTADTWAHAWKDRGLRIVRRRLGKDFVVEAHENPKRAGHKPGCPCFACKHRRGENPKVRKATQRRRRTDRLPVRQAGNPSTLAAKRATRERASRIRAARLGLPVRQAGNPSPLQAAVRLFEKFHGRDPKHIVEEHVSAAMRKDYTALGDLDYLKVRTPVGDLVEFGFEGDGVKLASSPDGRQLYAIGGNQNIERCIDDASLKKDFIDLGDGVEVAYTARKIHSNYQPVQWFHKFGEKNGSLPRIGYDKLRKQIFFTGGDYFIDTKDAVSPGIEN